MGIQRKMLEYHADPFSAKRTQLCIVQTRDFCIADVDFTGGRFDQAVDCAYQGAFSASRESHDDKELSPVNGKIDVVNSDIALSRGIDFLAAFA